MCMLRDDQNTTQYRKTIKRKGGKIICWKILKRDVEKYSLQKCGYTLKSKFNISFNWIPGWNISDRKYIEYNCPDDSCGSFVHGIHVYKRKPRNYHPFCHYRIVPVTCYEKDLVGSNKDQGTAVFMKVFFKKSDYKRVIKSKYAKGI